ncbi:hypothetical protein [Nonomuraea sp. PA05]|uniref:DUF7144 family membrane protein n=1 Tax=Nonomuraea sp. PA05 TaxID=2604466 RepID=UPI001CA37D7E|nr:hypothetical protein [Nonomuraea sp. PA05]
MAEQVSASSTGSAAEEKKPVSGWAVGGAIFAGTMMVMIGMFQAFEGLAAILQGEFYVVAPDYVYTFDVTVWGWIHLIVGTLAAVAGFFVFTGQLWARIVGIGLAVLNAIAQFLFMPYYPVWSLLMIAMDVLVIWALCLYHKGAIKDDDYYYTPMYY